MKKNRTENLKKKTNMAKANQCKAKQRDIVFWAKCIQSIICFQSVHGMDSYCIPDKFIIVGLL